MVLCLLDALATLLKFVLIFVAFWLLGLWYHHDQHASLTSTSWSDRYVSDQRHTLESIAYSLANWRRNI